jgi:hypothetical protein
MGTTPTYGLPYPDTTSSVDIPRDVQALANAVDLLIAARAPRLVVRETQWSFAGTALLADPVLHLPFATNRTYLVDATIVSFGALSSDTLMSWAFPSDCVLDWGLHTLNAAASSVDGPVYQVWRGMLGAGVASGLYLGNGTGGDGSTQSTMTLVSGRLRTGATAGELQALFCQTTSGPTSWINPGSYVRLTEY